MELKDEAKKEIERIDKILENLKIMKKADKNFVKLIFSYSKDAHYFLDEEKFLQAFEAAVIVWAYIDSGLHMKIFAVPDELKEMFTV